MNRRTLMTVLGGASLMTAIPAPGQTQIADADRTGVQGWLDECADAGRPAMRNECSDRLTTMSNGSILSACTGAERLRSSASTLCI